MKYKKHQQIQLNLKQKLIHRIAFKPFKMPGTALSPQQATLTKFSPTASTCRKELMQFMMAAWHELKREKRGELTEVQSTFKI